MKVNRTDERTNTGLERSNLFTQSASPLPLLRKNQILSNRWPLIDPRHFSHLVCQFRHRRPRCISRRPSGADQFRHKVKNPEGSSGAIYSASSGAIGAVQRRFPTELREKRRREEKGCRPHALLSRVERLSPAKPQWLLDRSENSSLGGERKRNLDAIGLA